MYSFEGLNENFRFLVLEIKKQLEETLQALEDIDERYFDHITSAGDYVDNLKNIITKKSYKQILQSGTEDTAIIHNMMALNTITSNLEKIGDYCENIVGQTYYFKDLALFHTYPYHDYFRIIFDALERMVDSLFNKDIQLAIDICRAEFKIDQIYKRDFDKIMEELRKSSKDPGDLITALFIFRYLERVGDALLNIGEAIISSVVGTRLKIHEYIALKESLETEDDEDFSLESIGVESRSGCKIEKVRNHNIPGEWQEVIFKEGKIRKLIEEKESLDKWHEHFPGLAPRIFGFEERGENASLLMEYLSGKNFQQILLGGDYSFTRTALRRILATVENVWRTTKQPSPANANFLTQLRKRLNDVYSVHPDFKGETKTIGSLKKPPFEDLIQEALGIEEILTAPFSVMIHGDFNNDNILFDELSDSVYFIDLHRSGLSDYAQDASVFIVSNFRVPILDATPRDTINHVIVNFLKFTLSFAEAHNDTTFQARLALGLVRSFFTSTRFALQKQFAKAMYLRSIYLLESLLEHSRKGLSWSEYVLKQDVILY